MKSVELLAPAKNLENAIAAINCGADAVYIGANFFGARVNASNSLEDIKKLVDYAHKFYVRVHVTVNTILNDNEIDQAVKLINDLYEIGVDAIIVQDMGILEACADNKLPPIQIHMSTQCDNRSLEKIKFFDKLGVSRVVLARELSINQIREICKNTNCEIETFIHGALCVSYSGQCYLSYANGFRSANRGECAQPCRKKYSLVDSKGKYYMKNQHLLSLKDFNASDYIESLIDCGVNSFKIEGRLKDINYVKNVVLYYNNQLNKYSERTSSGKVFTDFVPDINKTFNRSYTSYFLEKRGECYNFKSPKFIGEYIGIVTKIHKDCFEINGKVNIQDGLCFTSDNEFSGFLVNKIEGNKIYPNKKIIVKIGTKLYRNIDNSYFQKLNKAEILRKIGISLYIKDKKIIAIDEDQNKVSINLPSGEISKKPDITRNSYVKQFSKLGNSDFYIINFEIDSDNLPFLPVSQLNELRRSLLQNLMTERINNFKRLPQKPIGYAKFPYKNLDYKLNIFNKKAQEFYIKCGTNVVQAALESKKNIPSGVELMRCKHCLKFAANLCQKPINNLFLEDECGKKYPLKFDCKNCEMIILSP